MFLRLLKHIFAAHWRTRLLFPAATLDAIEAAIGTAESQHAGEIRFAIETSLALPDIWREAVPREHALRVFAHLGVWDTERNNGVLIYLCVADRNVEIVADRGFHGKVSQAEWEAVCRLMEEHFRKRQFRDGSVAGVEAVGRLIARHFAADAKRRDELPNRPTLL
jgi:uncharacterized membrane protein